MADTEFVKTSPLTSLAETDRPAFIPHTNEGTEHIERDDMRIPRLSIAQGLSDQLKPNHAKYIEGLRIGDLFNDLTGQVYETPLPFFIVRADPPRWMEWRPRKEGGGLIDPDVPPNDPRTQWTNDENGVRQKPRAMMYYDFILVLWPSREMIALSLKSAGIKHAKGLNGLIKLRNAPLWAGKYTVTVKEEPSPNGPFPNYAIRNAGFVQLEEDAAYLKHVFDSIKGKQFEIDREPDEEEVGQSTVVEGGGDAIPF